GAGEPVPSIVRIHAESTDAYRARTAHNHVVPRVGEAGRVACEDLAGHGELKVQHPVSDGERDRGHVRNCTGDGVQDTGSELAAAERLSVVDLSGEQEELNMGSGQVVAVFGAYGHTGRFVVTELRDRGFVPLLVGRDSGKLDALAASHPG